MSGDPVMFRVEGVHDLKQSSLRCTHGCSATPRLF